MEKQRGCLITQEWDGQYTVEINIWKDFAQLKSIRQANWHGDTSLYQKAVGYDWFLYRDVGKPDHMCLKQWPVAIWISEPSLLGDSAKMPQWLTFASDAHDSFVICKSDTAEEGLQKSIIQIQHRFPFANLEKKNWLFPGEHYLHRRKKRRCTILTYKYQIVGFQLKIV